MKQLLVDSMLCFSFDRPVTDNCPILVLTLECIDSTILMTGPRLSFNAQLRTFQWICWTCKIHKLAHFPTSQTLFLRPVCLIMFLGIKYCEIPRNDCSLRISLVRAHSDYFHDHDKSLV